ncbi:MAG: hypothetical protein Q4B14_05890, partial [Clostridia bacterium]|nr:hypothetical protein [Clostridia bacterium]
MTLKKTTLPFIAIFFKSVIFAFIFELVFLLGTNFIAFTQQMADANEVITTFLEIFNPLRFI